MSVNEDREKAAVDRQSASADGVASMPPGRLVVYAIGLEAILVLVAWLLSRLFGFSDPDRDWLEFASTAWWRDLLIGTVLAFPLLAAVVWWEGRANALSQSLRALVEELLVPLFRELSVFQVAVISIAAGIGEEIFFRWCLQGGLYHWLHPGAALLIASAVFGVCHWINAAYAVTAGAIGILLGLMMIWSGAILMPMVCHAVYDFVAILYLTRFAVKTAHTPTGRPDMG